MYYFTEKMRAKSVEGCDMEDILREVDMLIRGIRTFYFQDMLRQRLH